MHRSFGLLGFISALTMCSASYAQTWHIDDICTPARPCSMYGLTNSGIVFGSLDLVDPWVYSPAGGFIFPSFPIIHISAANDQGVITGSGASLVAFVSSPPYTQSLNLNSVFNWVAGDAVSINDSNAIVGDGSTTQFGPASSTAIPGLPNAYVFQINNAGQITASYADANFAAHYVLYTPGVGVADLGGYPFQLNNAGHVLMQDQTSWFIYTPSGKIRLPAGPAWTGINDNDEAVGSNLPSGNVFYSAATGMVQLESHLDAPTTFTFTGPVFINSQRQITMKVQAPSGYFSTVLLNPVTNAPRSLSRTPLRTPAVTLNGQPVGKAGAVLFNGR